MVKIFIDGGDGGCDGGGRGNGVEEKRLRVEMGLGLGRILSNEYEEVSLVVSGRREEYVRLKEGRNGGNKWGGDLFLLIEVNWGGGRG
ncbi:N-acetylmuramoyl-L-alanine amidase, partial [Bacillus subtilis]|uniref:N-acetylmuramoyl-L-alanine amidase n=1 Tax=Bacillus subtilis TaxID=1423 RepID=UPI00164291E2